MAPAPCPSKGSGEAVTSTATSSSTGIGRWSSATASDEVPAWQPWTHLQRIGRSRHGCGKMVRKSFVAISYQELEVKR